MSQRSFLSWLLLACLVINGCAQYNVSGPIRMQVFAPIQGSHCGYQARPQVLETVTNVRNLRGSIGQVVTHSGTLTGEDITNGNYRAVHTQFSQTGNTYYPLDLGSLWAGSFYYALETAYRMFRDLEPTISDMRIVALANGDRLENSLIFQEVEIEDGEDILVDNAAFVYFGNSVNTFINAPIREHSDIPMVFNMGIMVHEYTHMVMNYLVKTPLANSLSEDSVGDRAIGAMDEGIADYFGFLTNRDPKYFLCTVPERTYRDLSKVKSYTQAYKEAMRTGSGYQAHLFGAFFASAQYFMGERLKDHPRHAKTLIQLMKRLGSGSCGSANSLDYSAIARCHEGVTGAHSEISYVYRQLGF